MLKYVVFIIGDPTLLVKFKAATLNEEKGEWWVAAGPKFSLEAPDLTDKRGITLVADLQPGSGAWNGALWTQFSHQIARLTGENGTYLGDQVYEFGNEFQALLSLSDRVLLGTILFDPGLTLRFHQAGRDRTRFWTGTRSSTTK